MAFDEPTEHWAPPDSLDPTPVWKQYIVVVVIGVAIVAFGVLYAYVAYLPELVTPPATLPGRVVLPALLYPPGTARKVEIAGPTQAFYISYVKDEAYAVLAAWSPDVGGAARCAVMLTDEYPAADFVTGAVFVDSCTHGVFDGAGTLLGGAAPRGLDRYLVSRKGDRLVVNTDHVIVGTP